MSNSMVGNVYQTIIDEVINSSRVDFEESGVEESVLEDLRKGWQQKLSQLDVARFPWDPTPDPAPPAQVASGQQPQAAPLPTTQAHFSPNLSLPGTGTAGVTGQNGVKTEPGLVKQEAGSQSSAVPAVPNYVGVDDKNSVAASRAAQALQQQYGVRAAGSINAIQDRMGQQQQQQPSQGSQLPQQGQQPQPSESSSINNGQTDGPGDADDDDFEGVLVQRNAEGTLNELGRVEIDRMLHGRIAARAKAMEGGGLMLPLKEATRVRPSKRGAKGKGVARYDGGDDDDDDDLDDVDDEDAINSDLDDPEDEHDDDEVDDEGLGHIMLCMYDKVQRVKNKWKCTLKDGVLTVNGKEFVFHKATGEYEW
ncbi:Transcription factor IIA, alpha/beta subunit [Moelleriella libera RCEF 2490]|uniref:Transcription initiation factor IIA large subunit n=1 Tax=Moelleriella libera RCEF 2490 TaxID=1081109 RepID=A0A167Z2E4_9HYPO|nr:Transcription factor IIA, alpha/beta subunit [Moelleriella libera RCEF 2490]